jgi:hypothetical protein
MPTSEAADFADMQRNGAPVESRRMLRRAVAQGRGSMRVYVYRVPFLAHDAGRHPR